MPELKTKYLGLEIKNPLVASASSLSKKPSNIKSMEDAGISCVVLYSLFEEEINHESLELHHFLSRGTESFAEALTYFPEFDEYKNGGDRYLELISDAKNSVIYGPGLPTRAIVDYRCFRCLVTFKNTF